MADLHRLAISVRMNVPEITLRDYFAAQFLNGLQLRPFTEKERTDISKEAYMLADAMLKRRSMEKING